MKTVASNMNAIKTLLYLGSFLLLASCGGQPEAAEGTESTEKQPLEAPHEEEDPQVAELTRQQYQIAGITLGKPQMRSLSNILTITGKLDLPPQNMASVSAPLGGFVKSTDLLEGMRVRKGQVVARIENPEFVTLQQDYLEAGSRLEYLRLDYERQKELAEEQVTAAKNFQQARAEYQTFQARVEALAERLRIIGVNPATLQIGKISRILPIYAPISGYVTHISASVGQYVNPADVLFRIADTDHLHVELTVFEKDVAALRKGQRVTYSMPNEKEASHEATVYLIGKEISPQRTVQVHAHMEEEDKDMIPGMFVQAQVALSGQPVLALPETAVVQENGNYFVYLYTGEEKEGEELIKKFRMVPVEKGVEAGGYVQVGLPAGVETTSENFVLSGAYSLLAKMRNAEDEGGHH